ncbi:MAG TPA: ABC transporter permease [Vicinamibacterales bacterium]|nr:ABC transporter permease [Vicinamibacterales bacterium]
MSAPTSQDGLAGAGWTTVINPHRGWFDWRLGQLWRYRDLVTMFVWRDFTSVYKQTILGPLWHVLQPLLTTMTYTVVFGSVAQLSTDGVPRFLFYLAGTVLWTYFATTVTQTSATLLVNANLLGKVYFHRLVIPISIAVSNLVSFAIQFGIFLVVLAYYVVKGAPIHFTPWVLAAPLCLLLLAGYALGSGIIVAALTTRYRDLNRLVTFGVPLLMFVTPVIYPLSMVPYSFRWVARLNPLSPIIEACRLGFLGVGTVTSTDLAMSAGLMVIVLLAGLMLFTHIERSFADTV